MQGVEMWEGSVLQIMGFIMIVYEFRNNVEVIDYLIYEMLVLQKLCGLLLD